MGIDGLCEVSEFRGEGYKPLVDFEAWRVAILNYIDELESDRIDALQRHDETDEVFVLLSGRCILFFGRGRDALEGIEAVDMEKGKVYNVKRGAWHSHTLSRDAMVLIVENADTRDANSPKISIPPRMRALLRGAEEALWKKKS